jgi:putative Mn2+ efflux pump MntP
MRIHRKDCNTHQLGINNPIYRNAPVFRDKWAIHYNRRRRAVQAFELLIIAIGLAMDAFAVSVSAGITTRRSLVKTGIIAAVVFGGFHGSMAILGGYAGSAVSSFLTGYGSLIAFLILAGIGIKMIYESQQEGTGENPIESLPALMVIGIATSIDTLFAGMGIAFLGETVLIPAIAIGIATAILSFGGVFAGRWIGHLIGEYAEVAGGMILVGIGLKILLGLRCFTWVS